MEDVESHPIPQDVTGFQFKIIGDITIKQFAYLMGSAFSGWVFYQLPIIAIIKIPLTICIGGIGPALAFLPIGGRPMDLMILSFIKAFFKPTQFVYQKTGGNAWLSTVTAVTTHLPVSHKEKIQAPKESNIPKTKPLTAPQNLPPLPTIQTMPPVVQEQTSSPHIMSMYSSPSPSQREVPDGTSQSEPPKPIPTPVAKIQGDKNDALKKRVLELEKSLEAARKEKTELEQKQLDTASPQQQESMGIEKQLQGVVAQKEELTKQLIALQQKLDLQKKNVFAPTMATVKTQTQNVKQIPKGMGKNIGLPITPEFPNIITGIIKDPRGNPLANILVEIKDKEGNPVRAFKTNGLGQFISATALTNGEYTVLFEDPKGQNKFDAIGFKASGEIILPIEVTSIDEREELRKSLFREN